MLFLCFYFDAVWRQNRKHGWCHWTSDLRSSKPTQAFAMGQYSLLVQRRGWRRFRRWHRWEESNNSSHTAFNEGNQLFSTPFLCTQQSIKYQSQHQSQHETHRSFIDSSNLTANWKSEAFNATTPHIPILGWTDCKLFEKVKESNFVVINWYCV